MASDLAVRYLTGLVGRTHDIAAVTALLRDHRLVTLTGAGGSGKTRLAHAVAEPGPPGGPGVRMRWVDLDAVSGPGAVVGALISALEIRSTPDRAPIDALAYRLDREPAFLVLDNCEHVIAEAARVVDDLLHRCPRLAVLATSRELLRVPGERCWPVRPLPVCDPAALPPLADMTQVPSIRLFVDRATAVNPSFELTDRNAAAVSSICARLDGLPLAIELAAGRMAALPIEDLAGRLDGVLTLLDRDGRRAVPRHRTLNATVQWSYDLLSEAERVLLRRLVVFAGSFDLDGAEAVCGGAPLAPEEILPLLSTLADKSLIQVRTEPDGPRYALLETVRRYAGRRLTEHGEASDIRRRHVAYHIELAERAGAGLSGAAAGEWLARLEAEGDNLRAALERARTGWPEGMLRLAVALSGWWSMRGHYAEGLGWLEAALDTGVGAEPDRPAALAAAGRLALLLCRYSDAAAYLDRAREHYAELNDSAGTAGVLLALGGVAREQGRYADADRLTGQSLALRREIGDEAGVAACHTQSAFIAWLRGSPRRARRDVGAALAWFRRAGNRRGTVAALIHAGAAALYDDDPVAAAEHLSEAVALSRTVGFAEGLGWSLDLLGRVARGTGDPERADDLLRQALAAQYELGDLWRVASALECLGAISAERRGYELAARLFGASEALRAHIGAPRPPCERADVDRALAGIRRALPSARLAAIRDGGASAAVATVVAEAVAGRHGAAGDAVAGPAPGRLPASRALRVYALGAAREVLGGRLLGPAEWTYQKPRELLHFLLSERSCAKAQVGLALWPEAGTAALRNSFHTTLRQLRRALGGAEWVTFRAGRYAFNRSLPYFSDVEEFEAGIAAAGAAESTVDKVERLERALSHYGGDFLADLAGGGWIDARRLALRQAAERGLATLSRLLLAEGRPEPAAWACQRLLGFDELRESAHRQLMRCYAAMGDRGRALRHYAALAGRLADELGVTPAPETVALHERLRAG